MLSRPATGIACSVGDDGRAHAQSAVSLAGLDQLLPARRLGGLEGGELGRRVGDDLEADFEQLGRTAGSLSAATMAACSLAFTSAGRPLARRCLPRIDVGILHARSGQRRHIGQQRRALRAGHGQGAQLAGVDVREMALMFWNEASTWPPSKVADGRRAALVGHVDAAGAALQPEQLGGQVIRRAVAEEAKVIFSGVFFCAAITSATLLKRGEAAGFFHQHVGRLRRR